jgi:hypothetical protein
MSKQLPPQQRYSAQNTSLAVFGGIVIAVLVGIAWLLTKEAGLPAGLLVIGGILLGIIVLFSRVALLVAVDHMEVKLGPWEFDLLEIPFRDVSEAELIQVGPMNPGGYGVGTFWNFRRAIVVRTGDAVKINRKKMLPFVITVEDGADAVRTINERLVVGGTGPEG